MTEKLLDWDRKYANDNERKIASEDNKNSGIKLLIQA